MSGLGEVIGWKERRRRGGGESKKRRNDDCYQLRLRYYQALDVLTRITIVHEEKAAAKKLILHYANNGGIGLEALMDYRRLRRRIDDEVLLCTMQARLEYIRRKGKPHKDDRDQTIPQT